MDSRSKIIQLQLEMLGELVTVQVYNTSTCFHAPYIWSICRSDRGSLPFQHLFLIIIFAVVIVPDKRSLPFQAPVLNANISVIFVPGGRHHFKHFFPLLIFAVVIVPYGERYHFKHFFPLLIFAVVIVPNGEPYHFKHFYLTPCRSHCLYLVTYLTGETYFSNT